MPEALPIVTIIVASYLIGSIPTSFLVARIVAGIDIREFGSGNVGASNTSVHLGKQWFVPIGAFDVFVKGFFPVLLAGPYALDVGTGVQSVAALSALCGHNWPVFLRFSGGRGISVGVGALAAFGVPLLLLWLSIPAVLFTMSPWRDSAMLWLVASVSLPIWSLWAGFDVWVASFALAFSVVMILRRITSNGFKQSLLLYDELSLTRLVWNRTIFDRDITSRELWISSRPDRLS